MAALLTSDDLDGIGSDAMQAPDPRRYVRELVEAVDQDRIADPDDVGYALALAAEIAQNAGDQDEALALATRRVAATEDSEEHGAARARRAELLLATGGEQEGMAELRALRPQLTRDPLTADAIADALVETGHGELAEQWLGAATTTALEAAERLDPDTDEGEDAWDLAETLLARRRDVRGELGLEADELDDLAAEFIAAGLETPDVLFWPEAAFRAVVARFPDDEMVVGADWDAHRAFVEAELQAGDAEGRPPVVEIATPDMLAAVLADDGRDPPAPGPELAWPPGRNEPCWCGSRVKYKKCCLPRGRN